MSALALDTHRIVKRLREAGFSEAQAETVTDVVRESRDGIDLSNLATKGDLARFATKEDLAALRIATKEDLAALRIATKEDVSSLRATMKEDIARCATRDELKAEIAGLKAEMLKWGVGLAIAQSAFLLTALRFFPAR